jgi:hypothetical protein
MKDVGEKKGVQLDLLIEHIYSDADKKNCSSQELTIYEVFFVHCPSPLKNYMEQSPS